MLKVTLLINLERLVGKEKLNEAREAVFKALMADIRGVVVYKSLEFGRLVKIEGHSIIDLSIGDKGIAEVKILNGNDAAVQFRDSLEAVVEYFLEIAAKALGVRRGEVLNAIELINTPLSEDQVVP